MLRGQLHQSLGLNYYPDAGTDAGAPAADAAAPDLTNPLIVAAIQAASETARREALSEAEGLKRKTEELLGEKKKVQESLRAKEAELEKIRLESAAGAAGVPPEKLQAEAQKIADSMFSVKAAELDLVLKKLEEDNRTLTNRAEEREKARWRAVCERELYAAAGPDGIHPAGFNYLVDALANGVLVEEPGENGKPARYKIMHDGAEMPGAEPGSRMNMKQLIVLARQGNGPLGGLNMFFKDAGQGSGTVAVGASQGLNAKTKSRAQFQALSPAEQFEFITKQGGKVVDA